MGIVQSSGWTAGGTELRTATGVQGSTTTFNATSNFTQGNTVIVVMSHYFSTSNQLPTSVSIGGTTATLVYWDGISGQGNIQIYTAVMGVSPTNAVIISWYTGAGPDNRCGIIIDEWDDIVATKPLDWGANLSANLASVSVSSAGQLNSSSEVVYGASIDLGYNQTYTGVTINGSACDAELLSASTNVQGTRWTVGRRAITSTGVVTVVTTEASTNEHSTIFATFKRTGGTLTLPGLLQQSVEVRTGRGPGDDYLNFNANYAAGSTLMAIIVHHFADSATPLTSVAFGNVSATRRLINNDSNAARIEIWTVENYQDSPAKYAVIDYGTTAGTTEKISVWLGEFSDMPTSSYDTGGKNSPGSSITTTSTTAGTPSQAMEYIFGVVGETNGDSAVAWTDASSVPMTIELLRIDTNANSYMPCLIAARAATNANSGTQSFHATTAGAHVPMSIVAAFKNNQTDPGPTMTRPTSDITDTGWTNSTGADSFALLDETVASDTDYVISPTLETTTNLVMGITPTLAAGTYTIRIRGKYSMTSGQLRIILLGSADEVRGTSSWQAVSASYATYSIPITTSGGTSTKVKIEVKA